MILDYDTLLGGVRGTAVLDPGSVINNLVYFFLFFNGRYYSGN